MGLNKFAKTCLMREREGRSEGVGTIHLFHQSSACMSFAVQVKFVKNTLRLLSLAYAFVPAALTLAKLADAHDGLLGRGYESTSLPELA